MLRRPKDTSFARSRAYGLAVGLIVTIIVLQMITTVTGAIVAGRQFERVSIDTFEYVGELTAERVARFAEGARDVSEGTASEIEILGADVDRAALEFSMYQRLMREPSVRAVYAGWVDGEFLVLRREGGSFRSQRGGGGLGPEMTTRVYDGSYTLLSSHTVSSDYEPRTRPWYVTGLTAHETRWSHPFVDYFSGETLVSTARAAREANEVVAVVGADLDLNGLGDVLDGLPYGDGAEAFVLTQQLQIIGAPSDYRAQIAAVVEAKGTVARAPDIGLGIDPVLVAPGNARFSRDFDEIVLDRSFTTEETLPWRLHIRASDDELSAGLGALGTIVLWITGFSFAIVVIAAGVVWWVRRPLSRMRERAMTDPLTGLLNRREFFRRGALIAARAVDRGDVLMVTVLDLDAFKSLNDDHGHGAGDQALTAVAAGMTGAARAGDLTARTGGDEFAVLHVLRAGDQPLRVAQRVRDAIEHEIHTRVEGSDGVGVTAGYTTGGPDAADVELLVAYADKALVEGKRIQKGRVYAAAEGGGDVDRRLAAPDADPDSRGD
ncbi:sensor domain-containing diguanylate cyclase [Demequina muriae]|uniref:Diguanylate cyclase n=1 Tax=Demequina muriae TaxID=3051664 RepID=A0ABT8GDG7_9MICO|nr:diguanylate cyclase [Demequina sp. EGI L300058]MDN4479474.1 diguanylate cyclase [Demequina sp. EGI L300058]